MSVIDTAFQSAYMYMRSSHGNDERVNEEEDECIRFHRSISQ